MKNTFHKSLLPFVLLSAFVALLFIFAIGLQFCFLSKKLAFYPPEKIEVFIPDIPKKDIVVALLPHQDDELFMAGKIMQFIEEGKDVYVAVATDGGASRIRGVLKQKGYTQFDRQYFAEVRNRELEESLQYLGVPEDHVLFMNDGGVASTDTPKYLDGALSVDQASELIGKLYGRFGDGTYMSVAEGHSDHVALEKALKNFPGISMKIFFPLNLEHADQEYVLTDVQMMRKRGAIAAYNTWSPEQGMFAIAGSSVDGFMTEWTNKSKEVYYESSR